MEFLTVGWSRSYKGPEAGKVSGALAAVLGLAVLGGCAASHRAFQPPVESSGLGDTEFLHYLATVPVVTVDEGMRAVLMLRGPTSYWPTFADRSAELTRLGATREKWRLDGDDVLDYGTLAFMVRTLCDLPKSASEFVSLPTGLGDRRYALKTCVYEGMINYASADVAVSGGELLTVLGRMETCSGPG